MLWLARAKKRRRRRRSTEDITTDTVTTRMMNGDIREGGEKTMMATGVVGLSDDVGQTLNQDLHRRSEEETDYGHRYRREKDHNHQS